MRGLIIDYCGVLDGTDEEQGRWRKLMSAARANGVALAVLSNDPGGPSADPIRRLEADGLVDAVVLSGEEDAEKPEPEIFDITAERLGLEARECVLVDDSIVNIHGAVSHGMVGVFYQQFDRAVVEIVGLFDLEGEF
ncbi:HAD family hydrolase [uncultured Corynebacterium sp.]|uniref:HAD family hydrolase n=1 Tax=uncultured Corynebacterium sp. TaxID=159447 RepID=UPI0025F45C87|nr:HAD-IA family hydrolase [uncultured Corynebacterium sp.]